MPAGAAGSPPRSGIFLVGILVGQEIMNVTVKTSEALGQLAKGSFEAANAGVVVIT